MSQSGMQLSTDQQIASWIEKNRKFEESMRHDHGATICLSRKFGCQGYPLAKKLQEKLKGETGEEWLVVDKVLLDTIRQESGLSESFLSNLGDYSRMLDRYLQFLKPRMSHDDVYKLMTQHIMNIAVSGHAIIVGRGAVALTRDLDNCYGFRLDAPFDFRVNNYSESKNMEYAEAEQFVKDNQSIREEFIESYLGTSFSTIDNFNAIFNNAKCSLDTIADSIMTIVNEGEKNRLKNLKAA